MVYAIILAGGKGERFWPSSRATHPKQLLPLTGEKTMVEETVDRILPLVPKERIIIVTTEELRDPIFNIFSNFNERNFLFEPFGRNTAPAIAYAATILSKRDKDATLICLPADHLIREEKKFINRMNLATDIAEEGYLITFGIIPTRPETEYGYIEMGDKIADRVYKAKSFREKPGRKVAQEYLKTGTFLWNSGMFVFKAKTILGEIKTNLTGIYSSLNKLKSPHYNISEIYRELPSISIDYGVMERSSNVVVVQADFLWDDVGSWLALERFNKKDNNGNVRIGPSEVLDAKNCLISCDKGLIALMGVSDLVIVKSGDVILVCNKHRTPDIKELVHQIATKDEMK
jgi:mannose-1-phosphate guanylyltransferase